MFFASSISSTLVFWIPFSFLSKLKRVECPKNTRLYISLQSRQSGPCHCSLLPPSPQSTMPSFSSCYSRAWTSIRLHELQHKQRIRAYIRAYTRQQAHKHEQIHTHTGDCITGVTLGSDWLPLTPLSANHKSGFIPLHYYTQ